MNEEQLRAAHNRSFRNRECIEKSTLVGCFYCKVIYPAGAIKEWVRRDPTALCPRCGIDAVIGDASGLALTPEFLREMFDRWFRITSPVPKKALED